MSVDFRIPNIVGTDREQLAQIRSYLYQFIPQLQWALNNISATPTNYVVQQIHRGASAPMPVATMSLDSGGDFDSEVAFDALKPLIIKSADIVDAYYDEISRRLKGVYVAESDYGTFAQQTEQRIKETSTYTEQQFSNVQGIITNIDEKLDFYVADVEAYIRHGQVDEDDNGVPIYGIEVGQTTKLDGNEEFKAYARFTADRLSFFDRSGTEVAYVSNDKLYISKVEITANADSIVPAHKIGGYADFVTAGGGIVTKWIGGE